VFRCLEVSQDPQFISATKCSFDVKYVYAVVWVTPARWRHSDGERLVAGLPNGFDSCIEKRADGGGLPLREELARARRVWTFGGRCFSIIRVARV